MDNVERWSSLLMPESFMKASRRKDWKKISAESSLMSPAPDDPMSQGIELNHKMCERKKTV